MAIRQKHIRWYKLRANFDAMCVIDFRKGCYVGRELTIRTEHRGVMCKRILPCMPYPDT
ncbi:hypothetical protein VTI28DRAFT_9210 [Corynascus sepedonium]